MSKQYHAVVFENPSKLDDMYQLSVAVFRVGKKQFTRQMIRVKTETLEEGVQRGTLVTFTTEEKQLVDGIRVDFHPTDESVRVKAYESGIAVVIFNVPVIVDNLLTPGKYQNSTLGSVDTRRVSIGIGLYKKIMMSMHFTEESFDFIVEYAEKKTIERSRDLPNDIDARFRNMPDILKAELNHRKEEENILWKAIGPLRLVQTAKFFFQGTMPVFELTNKEKASAFDRLRDGASVTVHRVVPGGEVDKYIDEPEVDVLFATIFPTSYPTACYMKVNAFSRSVSRNVLRPGALFRFESSYDEKIVKYWDEKRQNRNHIFRETMQENPRNQILSIVEELMTDPKELDELQNRPFRGLKLNESQNLAVAMASNEDRKLVCIQGPPGTGKTLVLAHIINRLLMFNKKAIVLTPTKEALRNIQTVVGKVINEERLHPNALMNLWKFNTVLENSVEEGNGLAQLREWEEHVEAGRMTEEEFESRKFKLVKAMKATKTQEIMSNVSVVFSTIGSSFVQTVNVPVFEPSVCIIDEAAQVMEAETWPAAFRMKRIVLAGDPKQLPALVFSEQAQQGSLEVSVMERIMDKKEHFSWVMLNEQYRSNPEIMEWSNQHFYNGEIKTMCVKQPIATLGKGNLGMFWNMFDSMVFIDTCLETRHEERCFTYEQVACESQDEYAKENFSFLNVAEAKIVVQQYANLITLGVRHRNIAIITPYSGQVSLITEMMRMKFPTVTGDFNVGTVDSYQGQEFDAVLCSLVRSNPRLTMGFVTNLRRLNVVITRAKRHFMLVANGFMMYKNHSQPIQNLYHYFVKTKRRFPPAYVSCERTLYQMERCTNNFGNNFVDFITYSKDKTMREWCVNYEKQKGQGFRRN